MVQTATTGKALGITCLCFTLLAATVTSGAGAPPASTGTEPGTNSQVRAAGMQTSPTNAAGWRRLAAKYEAAGDTTNSAACWGKAVELDGTAGDFERLMLSLHRTDRTDAKFDAALDYFRNARHRSASASHYVMQVVRQLQQAGQTNRVESLSDAMFAGAASGSDHGAAATIFNSMGMTNRAIRHLETGIAAFETAGQVPEADSLRLRLIPLLAETRRGDELLACLDVAARRLGAMRIPHSTLVRCVAGIDPRKWAELVAKGETEQAAAGQQIMAAYMLSGSNLLDRAGALLRNVYQRNSTPRLFDMLRDAYAQRGDRAAVSALYTNRINLLPESRKDPSFVRDMVTALAASPTPDSAPLALQAVRDFPADTTLAIQSAQLLRKCGSHADAIGVYTNVLAKSEDNNAIPGLAAAYEESGRPLKATVVAFYGTAKPAAWWYDRGECTRILDRMAKRTEVLAETLRAADEAGRGTLPDSPFAGKVDWTAIAAWAAEASGDYRKAVAYRRTMFEKNPSPASARLLAAILLKAGEADEAFALMTRAMADTPAAEQHAPRMELLRALIAERRYRQAVAVIDDASATVTDPQARRAMSDMKAQAESAVKQEDFVQAAAARAAANPSDPDAQRSAAQAFRLTDRPLKAVEFYRRALAADDQMATRWDLAYVLTAARKHREAAQAYMELLDKDLAAAERDSAIKAATESLEAAGAPAEALKFLTERVDDIRAPYVKAWATARIQALQSQPGQ